jgi:hypothetical protein
MITLSPKIVRQLAVTRQRLAGPQPKADATGLLEIFRDLRCVQIDPIRAVERTQLLVLWSRLGCYDPAHLDHLLWQERALFEYWAHAASIVLTEDFPLHQIHMRSYAQDDSVWSGRIQTWLAENTAFRQHIFERLRHEGPLAINEIEDLTDAAWASTGWTNERNASRMMEFMWLMGEVVVVERQGIKKKWGLITDHLPEQSTTETWPEADVVRRAAQFSLRALGAGTRKHINNHFIRGRYPQLDTVLTELVEAGRILPVTVQEGEVTWPETWYLHADDLPLAEQLQAGQGWQPRTTLLSPFDNLICDRERTELLWDFYFRIEIYVPKAKRQYGYYVLPILHGERLIGRIDPKMDRKSGLLYINAMYLEPDAPQDANTFEAIHQAIADLGRFLGAKAIVYDDQIPPDWQPMMY